MPFAKQTQLPSVFKLPAANHTAISFGVAFWPNLLVTYDYPLSPSRDLIGCPAGAARISVKTD
eukprot:scaffold298328_cov15-Prasinocladus_malaysianus.AAC.1